MLATSVTNTRELLGKMAGVFVPISTPFADDEEVDYDALKFNLERYAPSGVLGYLALGSNGENRSLTEEEKLRVLATIVRHKGAGQVVMACATYDAQRDTERFLQAGGRPGGGFRPGALARLFPQADDRRRPVPLLLHSGGHFAHPAAHLQRAGLLRRHGIARAGRAAGRPPRNRRHEGQRRRAASSSSSNSRAIRSTCWPARPISCFRP